MLWEKAHYKINHNAYSNTTQAIQAARIQDPTGRYPTALSRRTALKHYTHDISGNPLTSDVQVENPFGYSGEFWDGDTGLQYLRSRWYDPSIGRFIQRIRSKGM
ncbi:hypothetical protein CDO73_02595 [Saccharibacillus sp. O23]|uniref:RHS repeat-associated core domain-containing protein n=1 Tax=Saccharibacillus sp. O23 TaxID=2009338 RepID=UPI000B4E535E|nr:hypothetical protein CDO73_02595 [Saccharibacillus sp. O23]